MCIADTSSLALFLVNGSRLSQKPPHLHYHHSIHSFNPVSSSSPKHLSYLTNTLIVLSSTLFPVSLPKYSVHSILDNRYRKALFLRLEGGKKAKALHGPGLAPGAFRYATVMATLCSRRGDCLTL